MENSQLNQNQFIELIKSDSNYEGQLIPTSYEGIAEDNFCDPTKISDNEYYKIISDNIFTDIATITNAKVIYDDGDYNLLTNLESKEDTDKNTFINLDSIDKALQDPTYSNVESFW